jgi:predicted enzyme related to lactoylglutathione lyase
MGNKVVHFELNGPDGSALAAFYRELFGWHVQEIAGADYWLVDTHAGEGINGGIGQTEDGGAFSTIYVESADPEALMTKAQDAGAKVVVPITETPMVTYGRFADADGLIVGIVKAGEGPGPSSGDNPPVDWFEITGSDPATTQGFYSELFGWDLDRSGDTTYSLIQHEHDAEGRDTQIGGGLGGGGPMWVTAYARVPDAEAILQKAEALGGKRAYGPNDVGGFLKTGAFHDPAGNPFGVYQRVA